MVLLLKVIPSKKHLTSRSWWTSCGVEVRAPHLKTLCRKSVKQYHGVRLLDIGSDRFIRLSLYLLKSMYWQHTAHRCKGMINRPLRITRQIRYIYRPVVCAEHKLGWSIYEYLYELKNEIQNSVRF